jgi:hypothetical protein
LPEAPFSNILKRMQVHFTSEQEAQLPQLATNAGTDAERLVKDAALRLLEEAVGGDPGGKLRSALTAAANTGKTITLNGFFKWPHHSSELVFITPIEDLAR